MIRTADAVVIAEISPARFVGDAVPESELRERCRRAYATHYRTDQMWGLANLTGS